MRAWVMFGFALLPLPAMLRAAPAFAHRNRKASEMNEARFWQIVGDSARNGAGQDNQAAALRESLDRLTPGEIEAFAQIFDALMRRSCRWDLWGRWLRRGRRHVRRWLRVFPSLADFARQTRVRHGDGRPDLLADIIPEDHDGEFEFEEFGSIALEVWAKKTGRDPQTMPHGEPGSQDPSGTPFTEDPAALKKRYPKLWARFGSD